MTIKINTNTDIITHTSVCGKYKYNVSEGVVLFLDIETEAWYKSCMEPQWLVEIKK